MIDNNFRPSLKRNIFSVILEKSDLLFLCNPFEPVVIKNITDFQKRLIALLDGTRTVNEIFDTLNREECACSYDSIFCELNFLNERLLLENAESEQSSTEGGKSCYLRYDRSMRWFAAKRKDGDLFSLKVQEALQKKHVVLFGIGGLGSLLFVQLALMGIGNITVVDYDKVEPTNLNRQVLFYESDVNRSKIEVARERAKLINSSLNYNFVEKRISSASEFKEMMKSADIAILAADTPRDRIFEWINEASFTAGVPVLYTTGVLHTAMGIGPLVVPGDTACYLCSMPDTADLNDPLVRFINERHCHGVIIPSLSICAGIIVYELIKHLTECDSCSLYNKRLILDLKTYEIKFQNITRRKNCPYCQILMD